jgi:glycosyltransferase involved in cell wall biosynthesis
MNKISVIVPFYNSKAYIDKCIHSVINQTYKNLEILLIDDGSSDGTHDICQAYAAKDDRIKVIRKENGGTSSARNFGLEHATGDLLYFIDSDDEVSLDLFEYFLNLMSVHNADMVYSPYAYVDTKGNIINKAGHNTIEKIKVYSKQEALSALLSWEIPCCVCDKLVKKHVYDNVRFPEGYLCEDLDIVYRLIDNSNTVVSSTIPKYYYLSNPASQMQTEAGMKKLLMSVERVTNHINDFFKEKHPDLYQKALSYSLDHLFIYYISIYNNKQFVQYKEELRALIESYLKKINMGVVSNKLKVKIILFKINKSLFYAFASLIRKYRKI